MTKNNKINSAGFSRIQQTFNETFGIGPAASLSATIFMGLVIIIALFWFFHSAPPKTIIFSFRISS